MHGLTSPFTATNVNLYHNAFKSLIFRVAEVLLAIAVYKFFSLIAARANLFTTYLMFAEDYFQRTLYFFSRAFTRNGLLILCFTTLYIVANLYGTLLWALDSPGYLLLQKNITASTLSNTLLDYPAYIVSVVARPNTLATLSNDLAPTIGSNLFKASENLTLTTMVERGTVETVPGTRPDAFPRIWLDAEGLSVSTDTATMVGYATRENGSYVPLDDCPVQQTIDDSFGWNCTFSNIFTQSLLTASNVGQPDVHWDDASDLKYNSRYIKPNRENNIWTRYGEGGGTAIMTQMFTVTKGTRRHTFIETAFRSTMLTTPAADFADDEVFDMLKRTWSTKKTEQSAPLITLLGRSMLSAQAAGKSYMFGIASVSGEKNITTTQTAWEYLTMMTNGKPFYSLLRVSSVNITLIRSETIATAPTPFETCDISFMNVAYGGKLTDTDCIAGPRESKPQFFGQVDTSAVLIFSGLGDGRSNISAKALDQDAWEWYESNTGYMDDLLIARGFIISVDPSLVTLSTSVLRPAISYLQLLLVLVAVALAFASYCSLRFFATAHWASSLFANVVSTVNMANDEVSRNPGYIWKSPEVRLQHLDPRTAITIEGERLRLGDHGAPVTETYHDGKEMTVGVVPVQEVGSTQRHTSPSERDSFLPNYNASV